MTEFLTQRDRQLAEHIFGECFEGTDEELMEVLKTVPDMTDVEFVKLWSGTEDVRLAQDFLDAFKTAALAR